ncbi:MAG: acetoacetate decarboxylase family protein, partial [Deltaproteobacteria bacterium]|nr:acetoacetate decarboxylase family protein [Deltaproteobacteria bacterium]
MKTRILSFVLIAIFTLIAFSLTGLAQDKKEAPKRADFIPSPIFSPVYPSLPHHFSDIHTIQILCKAPRGAIKRATMPPMEPAGDEETFILLLAWTPDVERMGFNVHEVAINTPVKWKDRVGNTTLIEYIDSDMGLIAGREVYGWPKKMAEITWTKTQTGWMVV